MSSAHEEQPRPPATEHESTDEAQRALDAASAEPRSTSEPAGGAHAGDAAGAHQPPAHQPSEDNTDRRA